MNNNEIKQKVMQISLDFNKEDSSLYISQENSSGCKYSVSSIPEMLQAIENYLTTYAVDDSEEDY